MQNNRKNLLNLIGLATVTTLLAACGGGGGGATPAAPLSGKAVDFYLSGATVKFAGCTTIAITDTTGNFTTPTAAGCADSAFSITGGTDIGTNLPFTGILKAPAPKAGAKAAIASPLTTLIASNPALAASLIAKLGLPPGADPLTTDPMTDAASLRAAEVVQTLVNQVTKALAELAASRGGSLTPQQAAQAAIDALSSAIGSSSSGSTFDLTNVSNLTSIISVAVVNANSTGGAAFNLPAGTSITDVANTLASSKASTISNQVSTVSSALANIVIGADPAATLATLQAGGLTSVIGSASTGAALTNFIQLSSVTLNNGTPIPFATVQASTTTPLSLSSALTDIQISLSGKGASFAGQTVAVNAGLQYTIGTNVVKVIINNVQLTFDSAGTLTAATAPAGAKYSFSLAGTSTATATLTNATADNLFNGGNVDLSIPAFLKKLSGAASLTSAQLAAYTPSTGIAISASFTLGSAVANTALPVGDSAGQGVTPISLSVGSTTLAGLGVNVNIK